MDKTSASRAGSDLKATLLAQTAACQLVLATIGKHSNKVWNRTADNDDCEIIVKKKHYCHSICSIFRGGQFNNLRTCCCDNTSAAAGINGVWTRFVKAYLLIRLLYTEGLTAQTQELQPFLFIRVWCMCHVLVLTFCLMCYNSSIYFVNNSVMLFVKPKRLLQWILLLLSCVTQSCFIFYFKLQTNYSLYNHNLT